MKKTWPQIWSSLLLLVALLLAVDCRDVRTAEIDPDSGIRRVAVNGAELAVRIVGHGTPVMLIMGYGGSMDVWDPRLVAELTRTYTVILWDNRGAGLSTTDDTPFTIERFADDAAAVLDALHVQKIDIIGWSMGTAIAMELALRHSDKVNRLALVGAFSNAAAVMPAIDEMDRSTPQDFMARLFPKAWLARHPDAMSALPRPSRPVEAAVRARQKSAIAAWDGVIGRLGLLDAPTVLIVGEEDDVTPVRESLRLAECLEGAWLARIPEAGHWLMYQMPEQLAQLAGFFFGFSQSAPEARGEK